MNEQAQDHVKRDVATWLVLANMAAILVAGAVLQPSGILSKSLRLLIENLAGYGLAVFGISACIVLVSSLRHRPGRNFIIVTWIIALLMAYGVHSRSEPRPAESPQPGDLGVMSDYKG